MRRIWISDLFCLCCLFCIQPDSNQVKYYRLTSPLSGNTSGLKDTWSFGETLNIELQPHKIRLLTLDKQ